MLDFTSLLLSVFLTAGCSGIMLAATWATSRNDGFLLTCALGTIFVAISVMCSAFYAVEPVRWLVTVAYAFLLCGLATIYGTAWEFRHDASPWRTIVWSAAISLSVTIPFHAFGLNGLGFVFGFLSAAGLLFLAAYNFWMARREAWGTLVSLAGLYFLIGLSFLPRAALVALEGQVVMDGPPNNWAQHAGLALIVAAVPALATLTVVLNQKRTVRAHRQQALTDPLTGLFNRRALTENLGRECEQVGLVLFDIDHFKRINDTRGHAVGDFVIVLFARTLNRHLRLGQVAARLGGDEFVLFCRQVSATELARQAEDIRRDFTEAAKAELDLTCTVTGGVAAGQINADTFSGLLASADRALYRAKAQGRDRLVASRQMGAIEELHH